ncbi:uncharacterized protein LOC128243756 [Mya arenaria]|uniref:uncharacterized protein LOC128243756 n=1 Tax=Mya arenaria TaxID=6604 RepID=UPI0022E3A0EF|nr:uncharacterized protein LOC128243756 [Mya arenaria]
MHACCCVWIFVLILLAVEGKSTTLQCFVCDSFYSKGCGDPFDNATVPLVPDCAQCSKIYYHKDEKQYIERSCLPTQAEMDGCKRSGTDEQATIDCWCSDGPGCNSRIIYTPNSLPNSLATRPSTGGLLLLAIGVAFKLHLTLVPVL